MDLELELVDRELTPLGELVLQRYRSADGDEGYQISLGGSFLMASHGSSAERAMAALARERLAGDRRGLEVLVGGLGAGHTLRAALDQPGVARVTVAEIGAAVVAWNRRWFAAANGRALDDGRVSIQIADVADLISAASSAYDMILLDVDNGPGWLAAPGNARLYAREGLAACRGALAPDGVLAVWSPGLNPALHDGLAAVLDGVEAVDTSRFSRPEGEPASVIYLASRPR